MGNSTEGPGRFDSIDPNRLRLAKAFIFPKFLWKGSTVKTLILRALQLLLLVACVGFAPLASAKLFRNAYVSFELPPNWECKLEGAEWVCENNFSKKQKEAIIILTAKEVGPADTLANYTTYLQTPKTLPGKAGSPQKSKVLSVQQRSIGNQLWVDGMHEGSEVAAYFTRYMATIKDRIAILVTFSAHKEHFAKYSNDFRIAIDSLRVVAGPDLLGSANQGVGKLQGQVGNAPDHYVPWETPGGGGQLEEPQGQGGRKYLKFILVALILGGAGAYLMWDQRKKGKGGRPPPKDDDLPPPPAPKDNKKKR